MEQLEALRAFIGRRSGIDWRDYGDRASFMSDYRRILRDGRDARAMLRYLEMAARNAAERGAPMPLPQGVNRMAWDGKAWDFTPCQYHAMEYRAGACRWLAEAIVLSGMSRIILDAATPSCDPPTMLSGPASPSVGSNDPRRRKPRALRRDRVANPGALRQLAAPNPRQPRPPKRRAGLPALEGPG